MEGRSVLAILDTSIGGGSGALDVLFLVIALAMIVGSVKIALRLRRFERRMGKKRGTGVSARTDTLGKLADLRASGSLSEDEFEAAKGRVRRE